MNDSHRRAGQIVDIQPLECAFDAVRTTVLLKSETLEILRVFVPQGEAVPNYVAQGEVVLHCLEGAIQVAAQNVTQTLRAGQLMHLAVREPFSLLGAENAIVLVTALAAQRGPQVEVIGEM